MPVYGDAVEETSVSTGTGPLTLDGVPAGRARQTFVQAGLAGVQTAYRIEMGTDWENGLGTPNAGPPATLSRDTVLGSSNGGALVNWPAGVKSVICMFPSVEAEKLSALAVEGDTIRLGADQIETDLASTPGGTRLLLWDVDTGSRQRVRVGGEGSGPGGVGRALYLSGSIFLAGSSAGQASVSGVLEVVSSFSPASIPGLQLWLDAEQGLYQTTDTSTSAAADGDPVGRWEDQSGNNRHVTQATAGLRGSLKLAIINNRPVVRLDGVDDTLTRAGAYTAGTLLAVVVVRTDSSTRTFFSSGDFASDVRLHNGTGNWSGLGNTNSSDFSHLGDFRVNGVVTNAFTLNQAHLIGSQASAPRSMAGIHVGAVAGIRPWHGDVGEILVYDSVLSASARQQLEQYLGGRWGLF